MCKLWHQLLHIQSRPYQVNPMHAQQGVPLRQPNARLDLRVAIS